MKHASLVSIILCAVAFLFGACKNTEVPEDINNQGEKTINFCVVNYKQYHMDDVLQDTESNSRTTRNAAATALDNLSMTVFNAEGNIVQQIKQKKGDEGYGTFSLTLPHGDYNVVFFGYEKDREVSITSPTDIHFADGYVPNCFYKHLALNVNEKTQATQSIVLERPIASFTIECPPTNIPSAIGRMDYIIEGCGTSLNATTGFASKTDSPLRSTDLTNYAPGSILKFSIYAFLPTVECTANIRMTAYDKDGNELKTRVFKNVPMKINHKTIYTGNFFSDEQDPDTEADSNTGFSVSIENPDWNNIINYPY